ncbi:HNH endonuclease [Bacillus phage PBC2]|uniref:Uncharacterized protein n=1 Tax=Bacillus phage PBC2 TaxID=1675029 RepID=A0A218KBR1_9CAUD|nr:HNH endonuclease [Bacillus phage PBC2]AKQ08334.1 hypothetical protein PBC2_019 [Bacillus phage PBC2]
MKRLRIDNKEMIGKIIGIFTVLDRVNKPTHLKKKDSYWLCRCECGNEKVIPKEFLLNGYPKCEKCNSRNRNDDMRMYKIWHKMIGRCNHKDTEAYSKYGAKGVVVSEGWLTYDVFYNDMINEYRMHVSNHGQDDTTLDRINVDKGYSKDNCRWATRLEQNRNKTTTIKTIVDGVEYTTLIDLSKAYDIDYKVLQDRYSKGWRGRKLVEEVRKRHKKRRDDIRIVVNDKEYNSFAELQRDYPQLHRQTIANRYDAGLRGELLVKPKEFFTTKEGKQILQSIREQKTK